MQISFSQNQAFLTNFFLLALPSSMTVSSMTEDVEPKKWVNNCSVGIWFCNVLPNT